MATIAQLVYTDNTAANKKPFLTDITEIHDSIQTYINDKLTDNLVQLASDCFPAAYAFDGDGAQQFTMDLYQPTTADDSFTGGDITLSTTGAWTNVDTTNAAIALTPELAGDFRFVFQFSVQSVSSNATNETDTQRRQYHFYRNAQNEVSYWGFGNYKHTTI